MAAPDGPSMDYPSQFDALGTVLKPGEVVLWMGRPYHGYRADLFKHGGLFVFFLIFALVLFKALLNDSINPLVPAVVLLGIPCGMVALSVRRDGQIRQRLGYVLTNRRAMRFYGSYHAEVRLNELTNVTLSERGDGIGTIFCIPTGVGEWPKRNRHGRPRSMFRLIGDVRHVHTLLIDAMSRADPPPPTWQDPAGRNQYLARKS